MANGPNIFQMLLIQSIMAYTTQVLTDWTAFSRSSIVCSIRALSASCVSVAIYMQCNSVVVYTHYQLLARRMESALEVNSSLVDDCKIQQVISIHGATSSHINKLFMD